jgi:NAD(P)-dependent dehydrogenase (short-subunit alcohol dehydrogenase family)
MPTALITGASRGIGLELTRQYAADGWTIIATCRNPIGLGELATIEGDVQVHGLDVTDHAQIDRLATELHGTAIDLLINNAGVFGPRDTHAENMDYAAWESVLRTNTLAPLKVSTAFADHVAESQQKKLVTISSVMASISGNTGGGEYIYRSSKAAVNMVMRSFACDISARDVIVAMFHPGWVQTDMGGPGASIDVQTSVTGLRKSFAGLTPADSGQFFNYDGTPLNW